MLQPVHHLILKELCDHRSSIIYLLHSNKKARPQINWLTHHHLLNRGQSHVVIPQEHRVCIVLHDKEKTTRWGHGFRCEASNSCAEGLTSGLGLSSGTKATLKWVQKSVPDSQPLPSRALSFFLTMTALCSTHSPRKEERRSRQATDF